MFNYVVCAKSDSLRPPRAPGRQLSGQRGINGVASRAPFPAARGSILAPCDHSAKPRDYGLTSSSSGFVPELPGARVDAGCVCARFIAGSFRRALVSASLNAALCANGARGPDPSTAAEVTSARARRAELRAVKSPSRQLTSRHARSQKAPGHRRNRARFSRCFGSKVCASEATAVAAIVNSETWQHCGRD